MRKKWLAILLAITLMGVGVMPYSSVQAEEIPQNAENEVKDITSEETDKGEEIKDLPLEEAESADSEGEEELPETPAALEAGEIAEDEKEEIKEIQEQDLQRENVLKAAGNADYSSARSISVNSTYTDRLTDYGDVKWYRFTVPSAGYISLKFDHAYLESSYTHWEAWFYDAQIRELAEYGFKGDVMSKQGGNVGLPAGTYYLKIGDGYYHSDINYSIRINYTLSSSWESEFNDTYAQADFINVNSIMYGSISDYEDADWYRFTVPSTGYISLKFDHAYMESGYTHWEAQLYDIQMKELAEYDFEGNVTSKKGGNIGLSAGTYYLKVSDGYYHSDINYSIRMNYTSSTAWESEFNDTYDQADLIHVNHTVYGSIRNYGDADWYRFKVPEKGYLSLQFRHKKIDPNYTYWRAYLYDAGQNSLIDYYYDGSTTSEKEEEISLPAGTYYLKITDSSYTDIDYNFRLRYSNVSKGKITKMSNTSSGIKLTWKKQGKATGYEIHRKPQKGGSWSKIADIKKGSVTTYTDKAVQKKNGVLYYYRVCAYNGKYRGEAGNSKPMLRMTSVNLTSVKSGARYIDVKWKKNEKASGYQIQYSKRKDFSKGNQIKTVSGKSSLKTTVWDLTGGKKYYVRVRAYQEKNVGGSYKTFCSNWSGVKGVTVKK